MEGYFQLGYIKKKHGFKGAVVLFLDTDNPSYYETINVLFVNDSDTTVLPYFISSCKKLKSNEWILSFEDVSSEEQSSQLIGKAVFLPENMLPALNSEQFYYHEIIGYKAIDLAFSEEMIVLDIIDRPLQPLIRLKNIETEKTLLIPLVDHFIKNIDKKSRIIELCAHPDLYTI